MGRGWRAKAACQVLAQEALTITTVNHFVWLKVVCGMWPPKNDLERRAESETTFLMKENPYPLC